MYKIIYILLSCLFLIACKGKSPETKNNSNNDINESISLCKNIDSCVIEKEILKYGKLKQGEMDFYPQLYELFPYALLLANKYDESYGGIVYSCLFCIYNYPKISEQVEDDSIQHEYSSIYNKRIPDSIKSISKVSERHYARLKWQMYLEIEMLTKISQSGYFRKKNFLVLDSAVCDLAIYSLRERAEKGGTFEATDLALAYFSGYWVKRDISQAQYWYKKKYEPILKHIAGKGRSKKTNPVHEQKSRGINSDISIRSSEMNNNMPVTTIGEPKSKFSKDITLNIERGNINAYNKLKNKMSHCNNDFELLLFSIVMADKHYYAPAFFDTYLYLWKTFNYQQKKELWDLSSFDPKTKSFALYHLKKSALMGNTQAKDLLKRMKSKS